MEWMDGWVDGWTDGQMDEQVNKLVIHHSGLPVLAPVGGTHAMAHPIVILYHFSCSGTPQCPVSLSFSLIFLGTLILLTRG